MPTRRSLWILVLIFVFLLLLSQRSSDYYSPSTSQEQQDNKAGQQQRPIPHQPPSNQKDNGIHHDIPPPPPLQPYTPPTSAKNTPNTSGRYDTLIVIPSSWAQMQNRQWVRETLFGIENNLEPCKKYDGRIIYKFYIHGRSTWAKTTLHTAQYNQALVRELYAEFMEFDDSHFTNQTVTERHAIWGEALNWAVNTFVPRENIKVDKVLIFDSTTVVNLPKLEETVKTATSTQGYIYTWGGKTAYAAMISFPVLDTLLKNQATLMEKYHYLNIVDAAVQFYTTTPSTFKTLVGVGQLWASDIDQVQTTSAVVGQVYQYEDWRPVVRKLAIQPTAACAEDKARKSNIAVLTSSFVYADMCMAEASLPSADNKRVYARKHGYDFVARSAEFAQEEFRGRRPVWGKIGAIQKALPHYEWLLWMDMDAIVADIDKDLRQIIKLAAEKDEREDSEISMIVARPVKDRMLNAGVMLLKNTDWTRRFLNEVQTRKDWYYKSPSYEQGAIWEVMREPEWTSGVYLFDGDDHTMNTFPRHYEKGDFVIHFAPAGCPAVPVLEALDKIAKGQSAVGVGI